MSDPLLYVRVDRWNPLSAQLVASEYVAASPEDIRRAAVALGFIVEAHATRSTRRAVPMAKGASDGA